jgi:type IV pilus assembly protein PilW
MKPSTFPRTARRSAAGFTLVEVMVGLAIGLIGIVIIMQVFSVQESYKRSTVGVGDAQTNGALGVFAMERELRMAGFGISHTALMACGAVQYYWEPTAAQEAAGAPAAGCSTDPGTHLPQLSFSPIRITDGAAGAPDTVELSYATGEIRISPATVDKGMPSPSSALDLDSTYGFNVADLVIAVNGNQCTMMQVSKPQPGSPQKLIHNSGNDCDPAGGGGVSCQFNAAGTTCKRQFPTGTSVFNMSIPVVKRFFIAGTDLNVTEFFQSPSAGALPAMNPPANQVIVNDIVDLQAEYGKDTDGNGTVDTFNVTLPATTAEWAQVRAIRFGLLARSGDFVKPDAAGVCSATTAMPTWAGGNLTPPGGVPSCFRYRVFETVVPFRNLVWREG